MEIAFQKLNGNEVVSVIKTVDCPAVAFMDADKYLDEALGDVLVSYPDGETVRVINNEKD